MIMLFKKYKNVPVINYVYNYIYKSWKVNSNNASQSLFLF